MTPGMRAAWGHRGTRLADLDHVRPLGLEVRGEACGGDRQQLPVAGLEQ